MITSVINSWQRIDGWLKANAPLAWHSLTPGVSEEEIRQKEDALGVMLPEDFKASYLIHNGCSYDRLLMGWEYFWPLRLVCGASIGSGFHREACGGTRGPAAMGIEHPWTWTLDIRQPWKLSAQQNNIFIVTPGRCRQRREMFAATSRYRASSSR